MKIKDYREGIRLVVYKKKKNKILYLILKRKLRWNGYETLKGGKLKNETDAQAIRRELKEETSLKPKEIVNLNLKSKFLYPKKYQKMFHKRGFIGNCYIVRAEGKIKLSKEHSSYRWLDYDKAKKLITFKENKLILKIANEILKKA